MRYQIRNAFPRREPQPEPRCIDCHGSRIECGTCLDCFEHDQYAHARDIEAQEEWRRSNYEDRGFSS